MSPVIENDVGWLNEKISIIVNTFLSNFSISTLIKVKLTMPVQAWVKTILLPWVYWTQQADKTRKPALKRVYQQSASNAFDRLMEHALTLKMEADAHRHWVAWAQEFCAKYQLTSSAVEGRNGYLAQRHHASRGFSDQSLKVLTILHNFDLKRADGSTAAQRLFGHPFPDPFEWILEHVGDLPMPRRSHRAQQTQPLHRDAFPA